MHFRSKTSSTTWSSIFLLILCANVDGFKYVEPPDGPVELRKLGQINATSCGSGTCSNVASGCRSGRVLTPSAVDLLKDGIPANCTEQDVPQGLPDSAVEDNGYIAVDSGNVAACDDIQKSTSGTLAGLSYWILVSQSGSSNWYV
jgi:hypothetical protein